jgi:hypothetical protein
MGAASEASQSALCIQVVKVERGSSDTEKQMREIEPKQAGVASVT